MLYVAILTKRLNQNPLDLIEQQLIIPPVIQSSGSRARMIRRRLRDFELTAIAQVLSDTGRSKCMAACGGLNAGRTHAFDPRKRANPWAAQSLHRALVPVCPRLAAVSGAGFP